MADWTRPVVRFLQVCIKNVTSILQPHFKETATQSWVLLFLEAFLCQLTSDPQGLSRRPRAKEKGGAEFIHLITSQHEMPQSTVLLVLMGACFNATN